MMVGASQLVAVNGLGLCLPIAVRYDYTADRCTCPACGKVGWPWAGWFSCESCDYVAVIETGEGFVVLSRRNRMGTA
jgi:hypothetical protein